MIMLAIAAMKGDDDKAFMLNLYNDYYGLVRKTVYSITRNTNEADLTNDTYQANRKSFIASNT